MKHKAKTEHLKSTSDICVCLLFLFLITFLFYHLVLLEQCLQEVQMGMGKSTQDFQEQFFVFQKPYSMKQYLQNKEHINFYVDNDTFNQVLSRNVIIIHHKNTVIAEKTTELIN